MPSDNSTDPDDLLKAVENAVPRVWTSDDDSAVDTGPDAVIKGPEPAVAVSLTDAPLADPVPSPFAAASQWVQKHRDARFGVQAETANAILERLSGDASGGQAAPSVAIIVAHPDDEAIGAGAIIRALDDVTIVHVTDGAPGDDAYAQRKGFASREDYARARREEVVAALWIIGVPPERIRGLGFVDGEASLHLVELCHKVADLLEELKPDVVFTHPYEGGHSDHDSTAFAVHLACGILRRDGLPAPLIMELTSYHNYEGRRRLFDFLPFRGSQIKTLKLSPEAQEIKRQMFDAFKSQQELLQSFPVEVERFRQAPRYLFTVPPHEGQLDYERLCKKMTGAEWRMHAERALETLRTRKSVKGGAA